MAKRIAPAKMPTSGYPGLGDAADAWEGDEEAGAAWGSGDAEASQSMDLTGLPGADLLEDEPSKPVLVEGLPVGSLGTRRNYMAIAEDILDLKAGVTGGLNQVSMDMSASPDDLDIQIKGMQVIGRVAAVCKSDMLMQKGCVHVNEMAVTRVSERGNAVVMSNALQAVLRAVVKHHKRRVAVVRACWTLSHIAAIGKIGYGAFVEDGGPEVMRMVATVWKEDKEITEATNTLARPLSGHVESAWHRKGGCGCVVS